MRLCKIRLRSGEVRVGQLLDDQRVRLMPTELQRNRWTLAEIVASPDPLGLANDLIKAGAGHTVGLDEAKLLAPVDRQEVWAAGVTYKRSEEARKQESEGAAAFYNKVYSAPRPEIFFKSPANRVVAPDDPVHIRRDGKWNVPEPELALVIAPDLRLVGFTIGNDMSSRDIEGENPLYLPQAKFYDGACAVGPAILLASAMPAPEQTSIRLLIERGGKAVFDGATHAGMMKRTYGELIDWLGRETSFPDGAILLTGTGIVPPDAFTLAVGDVVHIEIAGVGRLTNPVKTRG